MINKALDLPFDEPQETYSTSPNLFHDLGIPEGTKGRIVDAAPVERAPRSDKDTERRGGRSSERPARQGGRQGGSRERTRTRSGEPAASVETAGTEAVGTETSSGAERPARTRQRRRRRSPGTSTAS
jgi:hypothetical protein